MVSASSYCARLKLFESLSTIMQTTSRSEKNVSQLSITSLASSIMVNGWLLVPRLCLIGITSMNGLIVSSSLASIKPLKYLYSVFFPSQAMKYLCLGSVFADFSLKRFPYGWSSLKIRPPSRHHIHLVDHSHLEKRMNERYQYPRASPGSGGKASLSAPRGGVFNLAFPALARERNQRTASFPLTSLGNQTEGPRHIVHPNTLSQSSCQIVL